MLLAVDLAARFSAACLLSDDGDVTGQFDSWGISEGAFISSLVAPFTGETTPDVMVVEDLPHRLPFASLVKQVCRLQGRIIDRMSIYGHADKILFVPPATWRHAYDGLATGTGPDAVVQVAARVGYTPPDLAWRGRKATARKVATDYCAAYLIARWAHHIHARTGTYDTDTTSRY